MIKFETNRGFTLLEVIIALSVLAIGILGITSALLSSIGLQAQSEEMSLAMNIARAHLTHVEMYSTLNGLSAAWNEYRSGSNRFFGAPSLTPVSGNPGNSVGWIDFPENPSGTLNEQALAGWNMTQDLDGDTGTLSTDVEPEDLAWLPIRLTVRWSGRMGVRQWQLYSSLYRKP